MMGFRSQISILLLLFLSATTFHRSMSSNRSVVRCNEKDRRTLLIFKQGVIDPSNRLSTWSREKDCCAWEGVECDYTTGRVTNLDLRSSYETGYLQGEINLSLLELEYLNYLDLSDNEFEAISIPPISDNITPPTSLHYLDLSFNPYLQMNNLHWISRLSSLKYLNLSFIDLHKETNWLQLVATLPSLSVLRLSNCQLSNISPSLKYVNFTSLVTLDLSFNNIDSKLPYWLFNLSSDISHLDLGGNSLHGEIPSSLLNLRNLKYLDLSWNQLKGSIPDWLGQYEHLQNLYLQGNLFCGFIPSTLGNLSSLIELNMGYNFLRGNLPDSLGLLFNLNSLQVGNNSLSGPLSQTIFSKLSNLETLDLSSTGFKFDMDTNWNPSFQLSSIDLSNTIQGPNFPAWLYTQRSLETLYISSAGISSIDGDMFPSFVARIEYLYLFNNSISGDISKVTLNSTVIKLHHNNFTGGLPQISAIAEYVDVSHNSFSGGFPDCWENWKDLTYINMASNKLAGEVPLDLSNLKRLEFINLGQNEFSGNMPIKMPPGLKLMILRSNQFAGIIPPQLCYVSNLDIFDLAHNKLSGSIPRCVPKITNMVSRDDSPSSAVRTFAFNLTLKGKELQYIYDGYHWLSRTVDLSSNNLSGEIPPELFRLIKVRSLNLSHNHLTGTIPKNIGDMKNLESLDLSNNQLAGEIPQDMSGLSFLSDLNLSYNNFRGQIPLGTQLQSLDAWSFIGNPELCGAPLPKNCTKEENPKNAKQHVGNKDDDPERESLYLGMGVGFAVGFWGVCGSLFFNRAWRHAYFRFLYHIADRLYVFVALKFRRGSASFI